MHSFLASILAAASLAAAATTAAPSDSMPDLSKVPQCALQCLTEAAGSTSCSLVDAYCQCTTGAADIVKVIVPCLCQSACTPQDLISKSWRRAVVVDFEAYVADAQALWQPRPRSARPRSRPTEKNSRPHQHRQIFARRSLEVPEHHHLRKHQRSRHRVIKLAQSLVLQVHLPDMRQTPI